MKILAFGAHPDDIEFGVGGLIIKEIQKGSTVKNIVCTLGEAGTSGTPEGRKQEAENAAKLMGAEIEFLDLGGDCHITNSPENSIKIAKAIRMFKPEIVLAPELQANQHPDHYALAQLAQSACRLARYGGLKEIKDLPVHKVNALYYYPSRAEWGSKPDLFIDVSENWEKWTQAMACHESQMKTKGYINLVGSKASAWGASIGAERAIALWSNDPLRVDSLSDLNLSSRNY
jgi:bacillithiol biosynthesis deacetylase BshB1